MRKWPWIALAVLAMIAVPGLLLAKDVDWTPTARHTWTIAVRGDGPWRVLAPALAIGPEASASDSAALDALLATLAVAEGNATFSLVGDALRIEGSGEATLRADRRVEGDEREAFNDWRAPANVTREDDGESPLALSWSVSFSGGDGHACWADAQAVVTLAAGETRALFDPARASLPGRPWNSVCA